MLKDFMIGFVVGSGSALLIPRIIKAIREFFSKSSHDTVESIYVDNLNVGEIKNWFVDKLTKDSFKGIIISPTTDNISKWNLNIDLNSSENMLIQAVYDEKRDAIIEYREVVYSILSDKMKQLLDLNEGVLVIEK